MAELIVEDKMYELTEDDFQVIVDLMVDVDDWTDEKEAQVQTILGRSSFVPFVSSEEE